MFQMALGPSSLPRIAPLVREMSSDGVNNHLAARRMSHDSPNKLMVQHAFDLFVLVFVDSLNSSPGDTPYLSR